MAGVRGRGAAANPANRFERLHVLPDREAGEVEAAGGPRPCTELLRDSTRRAVAYNNSPDIGFDASVNPYRGCEHGCIYCYARPTHEYLGFSAGLDFETRILVKEEAPELLRAELMSPKWTPQVVAMSGVTDPYQPAERRLGLTRRCLEVLAEFRNPVAIITKNHLVMRDADVLRQLAAHDAAIVNVSVTTLDRDLQRVMEPRTSIPEKRLEVIERLAAAGVPVRVMVAPVIPGLTDHELPAIIDAASEAGARGASFVPVRLPHGVSDLFEDWLGRHFPDRKDKVLNRIRELRDGRLNDSDFHTRMRGSGVFADQLRKMYDVACRRAEFSDERPRLSTAAFRRPGGQVELFD